jgi:hypothetical protein
MKFHVIKTDTSFLLSLADMNRLKVYFNNVENIEKRECEIVISQWSRRQSINKKQLNEDEKERWKNHKEK